MIAIYRAARRVEIKIKHRFVSSHKVELVSGPNGERAIYDLVDGRIIEDEENPCAGWVKFIREFEKTPGDWREASVEKNEEVSPVME